MRCAPRLNTFVAALAALTKTEEKTVAHYDPPRLDVDAMKAIRDGALAESRVAELEAALREIITYADDVGMHNAGMAFREIATICNKHLSD